MAFHLAAFFRNQAIAATDVGLAAVNDPILPQNSAAEFLLPMDFRIRAALAYGVGMNRPRFSTPGLRRLPLPQIRPAGITAAPASPSPIEWIPEEFAPKVLKNEGFVVQTTNTNAGAQDHRAAVWLESAFEAAPVGPCWTIRCTGAVVTAANVWASGVLTVVDQLPQGRFAIVGMSVWGTNVTLARLIFANGGLRPGVLGTRTVEAVLYPQDNFRFGRQGLFGYFENTTVPQLELLSEGVTTTQEVFLDVVPIGPIMS